MMYLWCYVMNSVVLFPVTINLSLQQPDCSADGTGHLQVCTLYLGVLVFNSLKPNQS